MTRRVTLPGAAELFRTTGRTAQSETAQSETVQSETAQSETVQPATVQPEKGAGRELSATDAGQPGTGRRKHDAKITVYVSDEELLNLEKARLALRADHGIPVDRGRVVREAVAVLLADLAERGENSVLVRRLRQGAEE